MPSRTSPLPDILCVLLIVLACVFLVIGLVHIVSDTYLNIEAIAYLFDGILFLLSGVLIFLSIRAFRRKYHNS
jgi:membrane protein implicated in regulation of membrane protease activity